MLSVKRITREQFEMEVNTLVNTKELDYRDSIMIVADKYNIEVIDIPRLLTESLKNSVQLECVKLNLLKMQKEASLDDLVS